MKAPFPYFGGKSRVAALVWRALGRNVPNYIEPFFGSGAVLLARPGGAGKIETANDADGYLCNFWRALQADPESVAWWADWPVSELDLHARNRWLIEQTALVERMRKDPDYYDVRAAGWWVWGICQWIGGGWCSSAHKGRPSLGSGGQGVHMPSLGNDRGINGVAAPPCRDWFAALAKRLRRVRIVCGDFARVLGPSVLGKGKNAGGRRPCAVFLDPPYSHAMRDPRLYGQDSADVAVRAYQWAVEHGDDPDMRIALCGYDGEHDMPAGWTAHAVKGHRGYAGADNDNRTLERIWFSPHCLPLAEQPALFQEKPRTCSKVT